MKILSWNNDQLRNVILNTFPCGFLKKTSHEVCDACYLLIAFASADVAV